MKKYIEKLKSNKKVLYISIATLILFIGISFAYVVAQLSGGDFKLFNLNADTTDQLEFNVDKDIYLSANQFNFAEGAGDLTDQAIATARLKANSTKNTATYTYNVYLLIDKNEFKYTTSDKKTEILLQVTDPNGNNLTELSDLKYDTTLQGFDITEVNDELIRIAEDYEITSNSSKNYTEQTWTIKVTFINLDTNQKMNAGKSLDGKILIQQKEEYDDLKVSIANLPQTYGQIANVTCDGSNVLYNPKYNELQISEFTKDKSRCTINYTKRTNKEYLNNKIISMSEIVQGDGQVVHETILKGNYNNATAIPESEYGTVKQFYNTDASTDGTSISNAYVFNGTEWVSQLSNMLPSQRYHINFTLPTSGNYQMCYELSSGDTDNYISLYLDTTAQYVFNGYRTMNASKTDSKSGCIDLGYVPANTSYRMMQYTSTGTPISTLKFSVKKASSTQTIDAGYRYEGKNPNNWVWFNNELWRIIGVFDANTHGVASTNLVKIIRADSIGELVWNVTYSNDWTNSSLMKLLNGVYYNKQNGTGNENCYFYYDMPGICDYSNIGIDANYRSMIKEVTWKNGEFTNNYATAPTLYVEERENAKYNAKKGYIGLMYPSDYGYSVLASSCARTTYQNSYNSLQCAGKSWLRGKGAEWTLTPRSLNDGYIGYIGRNGNLYQVSSSDGYAVRPSLYLDPSVYIIDGVGTELNPYIIGM